MSDQTAPQPREEGPARSRYDALVVGWLLFLFAPAGLFLMWRGGLWSRRTRILLSIAVPSILVAAQAWAWRLPDARFWESFESVARSECGLLAVAMALTVWLDARRLGVAAGRPPVVLRLGANGWAALALLLSVAANPLYLLYARPRLLAAVQPGRRQGISARALPIIGVVVTVFMLLLLTSPRSPNAT